MRERRQLHALVRKGRLGMLKSRRVQILRLLHLGWTLTATAEAVGTYRREVRRVGWRYLEGGIELALSDNPRRKPARMLDSVQTAALIAMVCGPPPQGRARWTLPLIANETKRRKIVGKISKDTVRRTLARQRIKPWREKMWCVPQIDREFITKMRDVLRLYARPYNPNEPVVALDERPTPLRAPARQDLPMKAGHPRRRDYEYVRRGTANVFCIVEPKGGRHFTHATANRKKPAFVAALAKIARAYPDARRIHLVVDNLNIHNNKTITDVLGPKGQALADRFVFHFTPKHASWLNVAEVEASLVSRECLGRDRIPSLEALTRRITPWNRDANRRRRSINWRFTVHDAKRVFEADWFNSLASKH